MSGRGPRTPAGRFAAGAVAALVAFSLLVLAIDRLVPQPKGPDSSAYATSPAGLAAYADLLARHGVRVERRRRAVAEGAPPARGTLVVLDAGAVEPEEAAAIARWVRGGGRLVAGGARGAAWLAGRVRESLPARADGGPRSARVLAPVPETAGVRSVRPAEGGELHGVGGSLPLLGPGGRAARVADARRPRPRRAARRRLAAAEPRPGARGQRRLRRSRWPGGGRAGHVPGDRARLRRRVRAGALPAGARWALAGLLLAALAFAWSRARRIGPPRGRRAAAAAAARGLRRRAGGLARAHGPARRGRAPAARGGARRARPPRRAPAGAGEAELRAAAARIGLGEAETAALVRGPQDLEGALAAGRALAASTGGRRG